MSASSASLASEKGKGKRDLPTEKGSGSSDGPLAGNPAEVEPERGVATIKFESDNEAKRQRTTKISDRWVQHLIEFRNNQTTRPPSLLTSNEQAAKNTRKAVNTVNRLLQGTPSKNWKFAHWQGHCTSERTGYPAGVCHCWT